MFQALHPVSARAIRSLALAVCLPALTVVQVSGATAAGTGIAFSASRVAHSATAIVATLPSCTGPRDLIVDGAQITLAGAQSFDEVCIIDGGTVLARDLQLRAGVLYVDARSRIDADGLPGGPSGEDTDCSIYGNGKADGDAGSPLEIVARQAIVAGTLSPNGGAANTASCAGYASGENGGNGGPIRLIAGTLTFTGALSAHGGDGGTPQSQTGPGGNGGNGGTITLLLPAGIAPPAGPFDVHGGGAGAPNVKTNPPGNVGKPGQVSINVLSAAQATELPAAPAPLVWALGRQPILLPLQPAARFASTMHCGAGDLDVGKGATLHLSGIHQVNHVCVHAGGVLAASGRLTLIATTIYVDANSRIDADGSSTTPVPGVPAGRYEGSAAVVPTRAVPHVGTPGAAGTEADICCGGTSTAPAGGAGGGSVALVAHTILLAGTLSADGADGGKGNDGFGTPSNCGQGGLGAGGGSGGGLYIRADVLQLSGRISVTGGSGGPGGGDECNTMGTGVVNGGAHGGPGFATLLVGTLRVSGGPVPIAGPAALGRTLPVDPAPPTNAPGAQYFATTGAGSSAPLLGHSLAGPFLAFFQREGGLTTFGYPRTEPFTENGHLMQYTERFLLERAQGQVITAPLGRLLTAGRAFPPVAPFAGTSTRHYFAGTGHSLSGRFLSFWRSHDGVHLLGAPISEEVREQNGDGSGRTYLLQWFENGRLEYHPELAGTPYQVQIGLLGTQSLERLGWLY